MDESPPLLSIAGLSVHRDRETILTAVSFTVRRGSIHLLVGPNGAGKSTLVSAVLGQTAFDGRIVAHFEGNGRIGYVPQSFAVDRTLPVTVADFLALSRQALPVCLGIRPATRQRIAALLETVGLAGYERRPLSVLSGGELRRVLLAHAVDPAPELLILDEPASGLDDASVRRLEETLLALRRDLGLTVLMVSHDLGQVRRLADRVTVLNRTVRSDGPPADLTPAALVAWLGLSEPAPVASGVAT